MMICPFVRLARPRPGPGMGEAIGKPAAL